MPARVRFLSVEPLLADLGPLDLDGIDWVIVGGESGPEARRMRTEWTLATHDRRRAAGFFLQAVGRLGTGRGTP